MAPVCVSRPVCLIGRLLLVLLCCAGVLFVTPLPVAAQAPEPLGWDLAQEFRLAPDQANPNPDNYGHPNAWYFMQSSSLAHDPATYTLLPNFIPDVLFIPGLQGWQGDFVSSGIKGKLPTVNINATGTDQFPLGITWLQDTALVHPLFNRLVIVGWRSPISGFVQVSGAFTDRDNNCGNGVAWSIEQGVTPLARGVLANGGAQDFHLSPVSVEEGDFLYFVVDPRDANYVCDSTQLELRIQSPPPACTPAPAGLISWWPGERYANAQDIVGGNPGTLRGGTSFAPGKVGQAFRLDGIDDFINVPDAPSLRPPSVTLEGWFYFTRPNPLRSLLSKVVGSRTFESYALFLEGDHLTGLVGDATRYGTYLVSPQWAPTSGVWYHLAYTFDDSTDRQVLYVNGTPVASDISVLSTIGYDSHPFQIGAEYENEQVAYFFGGRIDEPSLYDRALTANEVQAIYQAGSAGKCPPHVANHVSRFSAEQTTGNVTLAWEISPEMGLAGFNLYRTPTAGGEVVRVNDSLIPATGTVEGGASYQLTDQPGPGRFVYELELVQQDGQTLRQGQVEVAVGGDQAVEHEFHLPWLQHR